VASLLWEYLAIRQSHIRQILYRGQDITKLGRAEIKKLRKEIIFQDPSSLNPRIPVGKAIMEPMQVHGQ
jgi:peptide/nickel transport system ATP-binding protein